MRTLWLCAVAGGPFQYTATNPGAHRARARGGASRPANLAGGVPDQVAAELARSLDRFQVPGPDKEAVLGAFAAHKGEVTEGYSPTV